MEAPGLDWTIGLLFLIMCAIVIADAFVAFATNKTVLDNFVAAAIVAALIYASRYRMKKR